MKNLLKRLPARLWLSFVLLTLTFEPFNVWPLAFVALIPWLDEMSDVETWTKAFRHSLSLAVIFSFVAFCWVAYVLHNFGGLPWPVAALCLFLFAFIAEPQLYVLGPWYRKFGRSMNASTRRPSVVAHAFLLSMSYTAVDTLLPKLFTDTLGHALIHSPHLMQMADLGGPALLTFLCAFGNVALWTVWRRLKTRTEPSIWGSLRESLPLLALFIGMLGLSFLYGENRLAYYQAKQTEAPRKIQMAIIQANIGDIEKISAERGFRAASRKVMDTYFSMSDQALTLSPKPEVILWPETAYPSTFRTPENAEDYARDQELEAYVKTRKTPLFFGGYDSDKVGNSYNAVFLLDPQGKLQSYYKSILIMFGEYIPGADWIPGLKEAFPMVGYFGRGPGSVTRDLLGVPVQPVICYEVLFPNFVSRAVKKGSKVLMNFTNDSWFGAYGAPYYHFKFAQLRSVESRIPQVRTTNTGFSALVLPTGEVQTRSKLFEPEVLNLTVPIIDAPETLMVKWGDWFGFFAAAVVFFLGWVLRKGQKRHSEANREPTKP